MNAASTTAPTVPAPSVGQQAIAVADRCESLARRARFADVLPSSERPSYADLAVAVSELAAVVRELAGRCLPR